MKSLRIVPTIEDQSLKNWLQVFRDDVEQLDKNTPKILFHTVDITIKTDYEFEVGVLNKNVFGMVVTKHNYPLKIQYIKQTPKGTLLCKASLENSLSDTISILMFIK